MKLCKRLCIWAVFESSPLPPILPAMEATRCLGLAEILTPLPAPSGYELVYRVLFRPRRFAQDLGLFNDIRIGFDVRAGSGFREP